MKFEGYKTNLVIFRTSLDFNLICRTNNANQIASLEAKENPQTFLKRKELPIQVVQLLEANKKLESVRPSIAFDIIIFLHFAKSTLAITTFPPFAENSARFLAKILAVDFEVVRN